MNENTSDRNHATGGAKMKKEIKVKDKRLVNYFGHFLLQRGFTSVPNVLLDYQRELNLTDDETLFFIKCYHFHSKQYVKYRDLVMSKARSTLTRIKKSLEAKGYLTSQELYFKNDKARIAGTGTKYDWTGLLNAMEFVVKIKNCIETGDLRQCRPMYQFATSVNENDQKIRCSICRGLMRACTDLQDRCINLNKHDTNLNKHEAKCYILLKDCIDKDCIVKDCLEKDCFGKDYKGNLLATLWGEENTEGTTNPEESDRVSIRGEHEQDEFAKLPVPEPLKEADKETLIVAIGEVEKELDKNFAIAKGGFAYMKTLESQLTMNLKRKNYLLPVGVFAEFKAQFAKEA